MSTRNEPVCPQRASTVAMVRQAKRFTISHLLPLILSLIGTALFCAYLFLFPYPVVAGEFDDLQSSAGPLSVTGQERKHFTDAPDQFPKRWLQKDFDITSVARWLDDEHIVFSARSYPGWERRYDEHSRLIVLHVDSGNFIDIGYRGELQCLNHQGALMLRQSPDPRNRANDPQGDRWLAGTWGRPLQAVKWKATRFIPDYLCHFFDVGTLIYGLPQVAQKPNAHRIQPLLPEHGNLKETISDDSRYFGNPLTLIKPDGSQGALKTTMPVTHYFYYQPWQGTYFHTLVRGESALSLHPSGDITTHRLPHLLRFWQREKLANTEAYGTRTGILWATSTTSGRWRKQGLFLETANGLLRIEEGKNARVAVSPNGCRIFSRVERGDPNAREPGPRGYVVIDLCKQGER